MPVTTSTSDFVLYIFSPAISRDRSPHGTKSHTQVLAAR